MIASALLLIIFWKPLYYAGMYAWKKTPMYKDNLKLWFISLWSLVNPIEIAKE